MMNNHFRSTSKQQRGLRCGESAPDVGKWGRPDWTPWGPALVKGTFINDSLVSGKQEDAVEL